MDGLHGLDGLVELLGRLRGNVMLARAQMFRILLNLGSSLDTKRGSGDLRTGGYMFPASLRRAVNVFIYILIHDISIDMYVIYICREFYVHTYLHTYTRFLETSRTLDSQHFLLFLP